MLSAYRITKSTGESYITSMAENITLEEATEYFTKNTFCDEDPVTGKEVHWNAVEVQRII